MKPTIRWVLAGTLLGCLSVPAHGGEEEYLVDKGHNRKELRNELVLREEQKGVAGTTGFLWRIKQNGRWEVFEFRMARKQLKEIDGSRRTGTLTSEQLVALARGLSEEKYSSLPPHLGSPPNVNPHRYILKFGDRDIVLDGVEPRRQGQIKENIMEGSPPMGPDEARDRDHFANVASMIEDRTSS